MSPRESNSDRLSLHVRGRGAISQAIEAAREFAKAQKMADDDQARLCVIVEELVANLYDHGGLTEQDEVELALACDPNGIRVEIANPGIPFDPWSTPRTAEDMKRGGGAGLSLIRAWTNLVSYRSSNDGNHLELLLPVEWER